MSLAHASALSPLSRPVAPVALALAVANAALLAAAGWQGLWLVDLQGHGTFTDFVNVWSAGRLVLDGNALGAYDPALHRAYQELAVGHPVGGYFGWPYPPTFLAVAALLALLPYVTAFAVYVAATFAAYLVAIRAIIGDRLGWLLAGAFPAIFGNLLVGQNGCLTAALFGAGLLLLDRRPVLAGLLLGLLSYKPHFGLLIPLALIAGGHGRAFAAAAVAALLLAGCSLVAFGFAPWSQFVAGLGEASQAILAQGRADWGKLQSLFGLARSLGAGNGLAWLLHLALAAGCAAAVAVAWRCRIAPELKAALLVCASLLATPYIFAYDLVVLAVPMAFLIRLMRRTGPLPGEWAGLLAASLLILAYPLLTAPAGLPATLIVGALAARRALAAPQPSVA